MCACVCVTDLFVHVAIKRMKLEIEKTVLLSNSQLGLDWYCILYAPSHWGGMSKVTLYKAIMGMLAAAE